MATTAIDTEPKLTPAVRSLLGSLRGWIRVYVCVEGLAASATWVGVAFWASLATDWFFEPPPLVRGVVLAIVALVLAGVLLKLIGRRALVPLSNSNMAMLLERRFPQLDDTLLTAVVLTGRKPAHSEEHGTSPSDGMAECSRQMLAHTCRQAAERSRDVELRGVFNPAPLKKSIAGCLLLAVSLGIFAYRSPEALGTWARRNLLLSSELWPRKVHLAVEGFDENGLAKVARGADFKVVAKAATTWPELPPPVVQIRYRSEGGARGRAAMDRSGAAQKGKRRLQEYSHTFQGVLAPIRFDLLGGDARLRDLRIEVVESPTVEKITLDCRYPSYMERTPRTLPATGVMQIPQGTKVTVHARANKDLVGVQIDSTTGGESLPRVILQPKDLAADRRNFRYTLPSLDQDTTLLLTLSDTDRITSRDPFSLTLATIADRPPQLDVRLDGIGPAITPQARLPATGRISDDYGIAEVWFEYTVDKEKPASRPVSSPPKHPTNLQLDDAALEVRDLEPGTDRAPTRSVGRLVAGQKLLVGVKAADLYDLGEGPNVGTSPRWLLDVVTPEQLRAMLESRELVLRQRFEVIIQEVTETRDLLLRIDFGTPDFGDDAGEKTTEQAGEEKGVAGAEPGDEPEHREELSPERLLALRALRLQRALTNSRKNAHETQGVADAFDDIRLQLINNRIDTRELNIRLKEGIADPLHRIAEEMFPELQARLERLEEKLADENLGPERRDLARRQADAILLEMRKVLDRMIELEDFNEAVELLRTIIKLQEQLSEQTKRRHKQRIRELLED